MQLIDVKGKVYIVTGATGAIGFAICRAFSEAGAAVVVTGRDQVKCENHVAQLKAEIADAHLLAVAADLTLFDDCSRLVEASENHFGRFDGLVHCAVNAPPGITGPFSNTDPRVYSRFMDDALGTLYNACHAALPALRKTGAGSLIAFVSDYGKLPGKNATLISSTRSAAIMFMRSLALEVAGDLIRCNCISPTFVKDTPIYDMMLAQDGRAANATARAKLGLPTPGDLAALTLYLCSPVADKITGQAISISGGLSAA